MDATPGHELTQLLRSWQDGSAADQTGTAERFFTPATAAPEQVLGRTAGVAADVYALGALLYLLLCGKPPFRFDGLTAGEVERLVL